MAIAQQLRSYMERCGTSFAQIPHERTYNMTRAAQAAQVSGKDVAKAVLIRSDDGYVLAVLPASRKVNLARLRQWFGHHVGLATEAETVTKFPDCEFGAIPPVGAAYGLKTVVDDELLGVRDIYFEGGDHRTLVTMNASDWRRLISNANHCRFGV